MTILDVFYLPFLLSFYYTEYQTDIPQLDFIIYVFFVLKMVLHFNTAYYSKGNLMKERQKIARHYLRKNFAFDFMALMLSMPRVIFGVNTLIYFEVIRVFRILSLFKAINKFEDNLQFSLSMTCILRLIKLFGSLIIVTHLLACIVHGIGLSEENGTSWLIVFGFREQPIFRRYIVSAYWTVTTMITVGYGDITPTNDFERMYAIFSMFTASAVFGYSMNTINVVVEEMNEYKSIKK